MNNLINQSTRSIVFDHGMRHDLRNLIACLGLDVELLSRLGEADGQNFVRNAGARAMKSVQRIEALLLNAPSPVLFATDRSGPPDPTAKPIVSVREVLVEVIEALEPAMPGSMRISLDVASDISVRSNPADVFRIFLNLLRNAIDVAIGDGRQLQVHISAGAIAGMTSVMISDNGPGLPPSVQRRFRAPVKAPRKGHRGRGQGLVISRYLARTNGGMVRISATGAHGTAFEIVLPVGAR